MTPFRWSWIDTPLGRMSAVVAPTGAVVRLDIEDNQSNMARSRILMATLSRCRVAQMCFGLSSVLGPISRPAFSGHFR